MILFIRTLVLYKSFITYLLTYILISGLTGVCTTPESHYKTHLFTMCFTD